MQASAVDRSFRPYRMTAQRALYPLCQLDIEQTADILKHRTAGVADETSPLTPEQMALLRNAFSETTLRWNGRRPGAIQFWWDKPLYRLLSDDPGLFEMVDRCVYYDGWSYRMTEADARRLSELFDSFLG